MIKKIIIFVVLLAILIPTVRFVEYVSMMHDIKSRGPIRIINGDSLQIDIGGKKKPLPPIEVYETYVPPAPEPIYELYGIYTTYEVLEIGLASVPSDPPPKLRTCTALKVLGGDEANIAKYIAKVNYGNTINRLDKDGNLLLNINPDELSVKDREALVNSKTPIILRIKNNPPRTTGGKYCHSFVELISVKNTYTVSGNYIRTERYQRSNWDNQPDQKIMCDSLLVTGGDQVFIDKYKKIVRDGNSINRLDDKGNLIFNLDLQNVSQVVATKIASSPGEVTMSVVERDENGRESGGCYSFVDIYSVQE